MEARIGENLERVRERIRRAARRAGRSEDEVTLVAVTKTVPVAAIEEAARLGVRHIGENRVQEAREKFPFLASPLVRHMIGRLQTNKVRYVGELFDWIHSLDRPELAMALARRAAAEGRTFDCLIQVNVAHEETKAGVPPEGAEELARTASSLEGLRVRGLMTIAPNTSDERTLREVFRTLRTLARSLEKIRLPNVTMEHLSMGMSNDFEIAIEEGATMVRVGSAIFGPRT